jgi:hypothetical protein
MQSASALARPLLLELEIRPIRSKSTWLRHTTNRSGTGSPFSTKYTVPSSGPSLSDSARVHASLIVFSRASIAVGNVTRTLNAIVCPLPV